MKQKRVKGSKVSCQMPDARCQMPVHSTFNIQHSTFSAVWLLAIGYWLLAMPVFAQLEGGLPIGVPSLVDTTPSALMYKRDLDSTLRTLTVNPDLVSPKLPTGTTLTISYQDTGAGGNCGGIPGVTKCFKVIWVMSSSNGVFNINNQLVNDPYPPYDVINTPNCAAILDATLKTQCERQVGGKIDFAPFDGIGGFNLYRKYRAPGQSSFSTWALINEDRNGDWQWMPNVEQLVGCTEQEWETPREDFLHADPDHSNDNALTYFTDLVTSQGGTQNGDLRPQRGKKMMNDLLSSKFGVNTPNRVWVKTRSCELPVACPDQAEYNNPSGPGTMTDATCDIGSVVFTDEDCSDTPGTVPCKVWGRVDKPIFTCDKTGGVDAACAGKPCCVFYDTPTSSCPPDASRDLLEGYTYQYMIRPADYPNPYHCINYSNVADTPNKIALVSRAGCDQSYFFNPTKRDPVGQNYTGGSLQFKQAGYQDPNFCVVTDADEGATCAPVPCCYDVNGNRTNDANGDGQFPDPGCPTDPNACCDERDHSDADLIPACRGNTGSDVTNNYQTTCWPVKQYADSTPYNEGVGLVQPGSAVFGTGGSSTPGVPVTDSDMNNDGSINLTDFAILSNSFGRNNTDPFWVSSTAGECPAAACCGAPNNCCPTGYCVADLDGDGQVGLKDFGAFSNCYKNPGNPGCL